MKSTPISLNYCWNVFFLFHSFLVLTVNFIFALAWEPSFVWSFPLTNLTYSISLELSNKTKNITLSFPMLNLKQIGGSKIKSFNKFFLKTNLPLILKIASSSPCLVLVLSSPSIFVLLLSYNRRLVLVSTSISSSCKRFVLIFSSLGFFNVFCSSPGRKTTS